MFTLTLTLTLTQDFMLRTTSRRVAVALAAALAIAVGLGLMPSPLHAQAATSARDSADIAAVRRAWVAAVRAMDGRAMAALVTDSIISIGGVPVRGKTAFESYWVKLFAGTSGPNPYVVYPQTLMVIGDSATESGEFGPEGGAHVGAYAFILKREADRVWRIAFWRRSALSPAIAVAPPLAASSRVFEGTYRSSEGVSAFTIRVDSANGGPVIFLRTVSQYTPNPSFLRATDVRLTHDSLSFSVQWGIPVRWVGRVFADSVAGEIIADHWRGTWSGVRTRSGASP